MSFRHGPSIVGVSLCTTEGLRLAARNLLEALETFGTTQLASYGYTGLPLLSACILEGGGKYSGLSIREKRKAHLTNRRIDGNIDRSKSVVVIDDSLSSGTSLHKAITALEEEGSEVEGTLHRSLPLPGFEALGECRRLPNCHLIA